MRFVFLAALFFACSSPLRDTTAEVSCACVQPDGGVSPFGWPVPSSILTCITRDEAAAECPYLEARVPQDAGFQANYDCMPETAVCHCDLSYDPDCPDTE